MTGITAQDVIDFAPDDKSLGLVTDVAWVDILLYVNQFNLTADDTDIDRRLVRLNLAAHLKAYTKRAATGAVGPVTGESAGNVRRSYGLIANATTSGALSSTRYGQQYLDILNRSQCAGPMVI